MTRTPPPPPRWIELGPSPAPDAEAFVLAALVDTSKCLGGVFVGPFAAEQAAEAWAVLERAYAYSGATFYVLARLDVRHVPLDVQRTAADAVMREIVYYTLGETRPEARFVVLHRVDEGLVLEADERLPTFPDARSARAAAERAGDGASAWVALVSRWWHIHM